MPPRILPLLAALIAASFASLYSAETSPTLSDTAAQRMARYDVIWNSPSKNASGVMPIGNGDVAAGVYAIENGDLSLLLAKNDAYNYMGDIFKTGRVRVALSPNPFAAGKPFRQTLDLPTGSILIEADGVTIRVWTDANRNVTHLEIHSPHELTVKAKPEFWERFDSCVFNISKYYTLSAGMPPDVKPPQDVQLQRNGHLLWYFPVGDRSIFSDDLKYYGVESMAGKFPDPFRFNTFGNLLESPDLKLDQGTFTGSGTNFDLRIHSLTMQTPKPETWVTEIEKQAASPVDLTKDWRTHCQWWSNFWDRSWIIASDTTVPADQQEQFFGESPKGHREETDGAALVSQNYNIFRYLMACQSRGKVMTKFNGGLFTQQMFSPKEIVKRSAPGEAVAGGFLTHPDDRRWGRRFTYQNERLLYWPMLASGDFDLMHPFFEYYWHLLPMRQAITKAWFGHEGAYFRENIEPTGGEHDSGLDGLPPRNTPPGTPANWYHSYYFTDGLETIAMMTDFVNFTGDTSYCDTVLVPFARQALLFFEKHYPHDAQGKLCIDPGQVLETWWNAKNPAPDVAGLRFTLDGLLAMKAGTLEDQARWAKFRSEIPEIPMQTIEGKMAIAPAEKYTPIRRNVENGELYPIFPFRCFGTALGNKDLVEWTMEHRTILNCFNCWTQDQIEWAYAGNAAEAARGLINRFRASTTAVRFPITGGDNYDECPDYDHFGSGSIAFQRMLLQEGNGKIFLFPAWPRDWDVNFKLHASEKTTVEATLHDGKITNLKVTPENRRKDLVICEPQVMSAPTPQATVTPKQTQTPSILSTASPKPVQP